MKRLAAAAVLTAAGLLSACQPVSSIAPGERVWEGTVRIDGVEEVEATESLVIRPGTRVLFAFRDDDGDGWGDSGILVKGRILALGTEEEPIFFQPEEADDRPGRWNEIRVESGRSSGFASCRFSGGRWALHGHFTPLRVEASRFSRNFGAVKFRGGPVRLYGNDFFRNGTAIRYWESEPEIISNVIRDNGTGVFCREGSRKSLLRGNNFLRSSDYHVKLGELQDRDVDARFNFWGSAVPARIEEMIFDREDVSYLGRVLYDPPESGPFPLSVEGAGEGE
jgi:hypothetical protein